MKTTTILMRHYELTVINSSPDIFFIIFNWFFQSVTQRILKKFKLDPHDSNICPFNLHPEQTEETHTFCRNLSLHLIQDLHGWAMPSSMIFGNTSLIRGFLSRSSQVVKFSEALKDVKLVKMNENRFEYFVARILVSDFFSERALEECGMGFSPWHLF